jgi:hypothetical protein
VEPPQQDDHVSRYLQTFLQQWNGLLNVHSARLDWQVMRDPNVPVSAAVFHVIRSEAEASHDSASPARWRDALERFATAADIGGHRDERLYREGLVRAVFDDGIVIVKRNEPRLWSRSAAREDAEATMLQATRLGPP